MTRISAPRTDPERTSPPFGAPSGFSLLEILICLALLGILAAGFAGVFQGSLAISRQQEQEALRLRDRRQAVRMQFGRVEGAPEVIAVRED